MESGTAFIIRGKVCSRTKHSAFIAGAPTAVPLDVRGTAQRILLRMENGIFRGSDPGGFVASS
jgi:hypothetical protein